MCGPTARSFDRGQLESNTGYGVVENMADSWHIYLFIIAFLPQFKSWQCFFCSVLDCSMNWCKWWSSQQGGQQMTPASTGAQRSKHPDIKTVAGKCACSGKIALCPCAIARLHAKIGKPMWPCHGVYAGVMHRGTVGGQKCLIFSQIRYLTIQLCAMIYFAY